MKPPIRTANLKLGELPATVTESELDHLNELEVDLKRLNSYVKGICQPFAESAVSSAEEAFLNEPSSDNYKELYSAHVALGLIERSVLPQRLRAIIEIAVTHYERKLKEFAQPILQRFLDLAWERYEQIAHSERDRHRQLGVSLPPDPPQQRPNENQFGGAPKTWRAGNLILETAMRPVSTLEGLMASNTDYRAILKFLREHGAL